MRKLHITTLILLISIASGWAIANSSRTFPTGVFMQKSPLCTDPTSEDGVCKSNFKDCLSQSREPTIESIFTVFRHDKAYVHFHTICR